MVSSNDAGNQGARGLVAEVASGPKLMVQCGAVPMPSIGNELEAVRREIDICLKTVKSQSADSARRTDCVIVRSLIEGREALEF